MDIAYTFQNGLEADLKVSGPDFASDKDLESAVIFSLFTDRRADPDEVADPMDRRGWWADTFPNVEGDKIGSKLWLLQREKQTQQTLNRARVYCQEALAWLVDDGVAESVDIEVEWVRMGFLGISVTVYRPEGDETFQYEAAWDQFKETT